MTPEQFCYWLQGRAEFDPTPPTPEQWQSIREHLQTVFTKVTPPVRIPGPIIKEGPDHWIMPQGAGDFPRFPPATCTP
ncbi:MAG TPA: hypothetical protein VF655_10000 [Allosphingosinicella sp.]|jgi:hypothetical protein